MTTPLGDRPDNPRALVPAGSEVSRLSVGSFAFLSTLEPKGKADLLEHLQHLAGVLASVNLVINGDEHSGTHNSNGKALHHDEALESTLNRGYRSKLTRALRAYLEKDPIKAHEMAARQLREYLGPREKKLRLADIRRDVRNRRASQRIPTITL